MIKDCKDVEVRGICPFDDLIMEMFKSRDDLHALHSIEGYIIKNKYDYCLVHLLTLVNCCRGYINTSLMADKK